MLGVTLATIYYAASADPTLCAGKQDLQNAVQLPVGSKFSRKQFLPELYLYKH